MASYGQACMQDLHPIQISLSKSTMPSSRVNSELVGQIYTQGASVQWLQRMTPKSRVESGKVPESTYLTQVRNCPTGMSCSVLQATVHAWHPMQVRWSIAKPYLMTVLPSPHRAAGSAPPGRPWRPAGRPG